MKVYIVESDDRISGVYKTLELAIQSHPPRPPKPGILKAIDLYHQGLGPQPAIYEREGGWIRLSILPDGTENWSNGLDLGDSAFITSYEVQE